MVKPENGCFGAYRPHSFNADKVGVAGLHQTPPNCYGKPVGIGVFGNWFRQNYGKRFGLWLRKHVTTDKQKVFHSFRHTVSYCLKMRDVPEPLIMQILGHTNTNMSTGR